VIPLRIEEGTVGNIENKKIPSSHRARCSSGSSLHNARMVNQQWREDGSQLSLDGMSETMQSAEQDWQSNIPADEQGLLEYFVKKIFDGTPVNFAIIGSTLALGTLFFFWVGLHFMAIFANIILTCGILLEILLVVKRLAMHDKAKKMMVIRPPSQWYDGGDIHGSVVAFKQLMERQRRPHQKP
jgi:hypothetical protein